MKVSVEVRRIDLQCVGNVRNAPEKTFVHTALSKYSKSEKTPQVWLPRKQISHKIIYNCANEVEFSFNPLIDHGSSVSILTDIRHEENDVDDRKFLASIAFTRIINAGDCIELEMKETEHTSQQRAVLRVTVSIAKKSGNDQLAVSKVVGCIDMIKTGCELLNKCPEVYASDKQTMSQIIADATRMLKTFAQSKREFARGKQTTLFDRALVFQPDLDRPHHTKEKVAKQRANWILEPMNDKNLCRQWESCHWVSTTRRQSFDLTGFFLSVRKL